MTEPLLVLDVDGTLSPYAPAGGWGDFAASPHVRLETLLSARMGAALAALPARRAWLSDWGPAANRLIGVTLGWPELPVLPHPDVLGWWKLAALRAWRPRRGVPLVWADDQLSGHPEAAAWASRLSTPTLLIAPDPTIGLTEGHVAQIAAFLAEHTT